MKIVLRQNCIHKFSRDLQLEYVDWKVTTLFIGTYNPGCCKVNNAEWFYGRTDNNMFWNTLGYIYEQNSLLGTEGNPDQWKEFCKRNELAVTDLIFAIKVKPDEMGEKLCKNFSDGMLEPFLLDNFILSSKLEELIDNSTKLKDLKCVYLTRSTTNKAWNILWKPINTSCRKRKIHVAKLTTPGGFNYFQFKTGFPRTPENLVQLWHKKGFVNCNS